MINTGTLVGDGGRHSKGRRFSVDEVENPVRAREFLEVREKGEKKA